MRTRPRPTRSILEAGHAFVAVTTPPLVRALPRNPHRLGRRRDRPTRLDQLDQTPSTFRRERSITVHESLPGVVVPSDSSTLAQEAHLIAAITNVPNYNT